MRFRATVRLDGKTATGIPVPADVVSGLGPGKRPKVRVTIGSYTYRSSIGSMGGEFMLPISAPHRSGAGVAAGDEVDVDLELDDEPREVAVPSDLRAALEADPVAARSFGALSYSQRQRHVLSVEGAKTAETRQRRITRAVEGLRGGAG